MRAFLLRRQAMKSCKLHNVGFIADERVGGYQAEILAAVATHNAGVPFLDQEHVAFVRFGTGGTIISWDFNGNGLMDDEDITWLTREAYRRLTRDPAYNWAYDQDADGDIDTDDVTAWCNTFGTTIGDATLDGVVDFNDQTVVSASIANGGSGYGWGDGDFSGDGLVNQTDQDLLDQY